MMLRPVNVASGRRSERCSRSPSRLGVCHGRLHRTAILSIFVILVAGAGIQSIANAQTDCSVKGEWSAVMAWPQLAVHMHILPTGKVMTWTEDEDDAESRGSYLWDPDTAEFTRTTQPASGAPPTRYDAFCSGHSFLADGRLFATGGSDETIGVLSFSHASAYDPWTGEWEQTPDMNAGRYYATNTTLGNAQVLVIAGSNTSNSDKNTLPQVFQPSTWSWRNLTGAVKSLPPYPWMFLAPNGQVFMAGPRADTRYLNPAGTGKWAAVGKTRFASARTKGTAVMYDKGKILIMGGGTPPTATAEVINLNVTPSWRFVGSMTSRRYNQNAVLLPDGKVLVIGGSFTASRNDATKAVLHAEMWDPSTEVWCPLARMSVPRLYHSTAALLPDGRVLVAGGDTAEYKNAEIFSPPYLFKEPRPTITSAPPGVTYGETFPVGTQDAAEIARVTWIRLPSVTHSLDQNQRINSLSFSLATGVLNVTAPSSTNQNSSPPGHYMLFILNSSGVPSTAKIIKIG